MKTQIVLGLAIVLAMAACQKQEKRYTQQSTEIDTYKKVIDDYVKQDWEAFASHYADTAKIMNNATEKDGQTLTELVNMNKSDAALFSSYNYVDGESTYEMIIDDKGRTWVNFWGTWEGTLNANNKKYIIPAHGTAQFVDGKIVMEYGYWDLSKIMLDMQAMKDAEKSTIQDGAMQETEGSNNQ